MSDFGSASIYYESELQEIIKPNPLVIVNSLGFCQQKTLPQCIYLSRFGREYFDR